MNEKVIFNWSKKYDFKKAIIKCDKENNPKSLINKNKIHVDIIVPKKFNNEDKINYIQNN